MLTGRKVGGKLLSIRRMVREGSRRVILSRGLTRVRLSQLDLLWIHFHPRSPRMFGKCKGKAA